MHESDQSALFSAEVTDQCSCNCASPVYLHVVHRGSFTFYHYLGGITSISMCNSDLQKTRMVWSHGTVSHYAVLCCVKTQNITL